MTNSFTSILIFCFILVVSCNNSVNSQAPKAVKATFKAKYPDENDPDWHKDSHGNYESHFKIDGIKYRADFKPDGSWIETETSIDKKDLPKAIRDIIKKDFDGEISEIEKVDHHSKGVFYDVEFKQKGENKDIEFKADGTIIN
ncbi:Putative beta-lactamase-inhibitor-like, PepSY-like [Hyunsoonleella jejuensis]|uniref:Putative beta-lactamase-inhibitor-like, PepSY-like n=1 Tax=Hyunsoonleella jejuensis TaxID=419940 RepID=A0A1H9BMU7_9FLAO|nr:PepSY-like domain-containing protein [Hyunsoonleella jejuensis]SEP89863.1 Putative beta-lactamase-inhibitor-like, PepSY-like [Hyunsoonleella jejuensis]